MEENTKLANCLLCGDPCNSKIHGILCIVIFVTAPWFLFIICACRYFSK